MREDAGTSQAGEGVVGTADDTAAADSAAALPPAVRSLWAQVQGLVDGLAVQVQQAARSFAFAFVEGTLVRALRDGHWILLDEVNLANPETLECLNSVLDATSGSVVLTERGDLTPVKRHPNFRLFACMNPATDVGKRNLPQGLRNR